MLVSYPLAYLVIRTIKETNYDTEKMVYVDDLRREGMEQGTPHEEKSSIDKEAPGA